jgi:hypothetical protein
MAVSVTMGIHSVLPAEPSAERESRPEVSPHDAELQIEGAAEGDLLLKDGAQRLLEVGRGRAEVSTVTRLGKRVANGQIALHDDAGRCGAAAFALRGPRH